MFVVLFHFKIFQLGVLPTICVTKLDWSYFKNLSVLNKFYAMINVDFSSSKCFAVFE